MIRVFAFLALVSTAWAVALHKASTGPSDTPISTVAPKLPGGTVAVVATPGPFFKDFKPPFPTDAWWSGFTVGNQANNVAGPFPFQSSTTNTGLTFGLSDIRNFNGKSLQVNTQKDLTVGIAGLPNEITNRKAVSWDTQTVCLQYFNDAKATMDTCLVPGSPYMTFTFNNAAVVITSSKGNILSFEWIQEGVKGKLKNDGGTYILYVIAKPIEFTVDKKTLTSPAGYSGTLRFAKLKEASQEAILDQHSQTYPTKLTMSYNVAGDVGTQTWTWDVVGNPGDLLTLSWPHHRKTLQGPNYVNIQYLTLKGQMKGVRGNVWTHKHNLPTISWFAKNPPQASCVPELIKTLEAEIGELKSSKPGDFYFWGGTFATRARLALIAEHVGRNDLIDKVVKVTKESIEHWFDPKQKPAAAYETGWGGFVNGDGWNSTNVDFGNTYYNDHHFHYGYLMTGAAVIGKYDPAWLKKNIDFLNHVARDYLNPSPNDPHYTVTRHMDFFAGHSWASGIANSAGPRGQESSGEAINGYYGLLLFAHASNNQALIDYSRLLLAIEIAGAQEYWHLYPKRNIADETYPEQVLRDLVTIGNVRDFEVGAWLHWGTGDVNIAAIQILPLTPIGEYAYDKEWMEEVVPYCQKELDDVTIGDSKKSVILAAYAMVSPQKAYVASQNLFDWGTGNTASNQLYFISTQPSNKDICLTASQTPEGLFTIQDVASGKFVSVASGGGLSASVGADVLASKFTLKFKPGGGTILADNGKFVTAQPNGNSALAASKDTAASYETFKWSVQKEGTYELIAGVNKAKVSTNKDTGELKNSGTASKYRLTPASTDAPAPVPAKGILKSVESGNFVVSTKAQPKLVANGKAKGDATTFNFAKLDSSPDNAPVYTIQSQITDLYVTGNADGTTALTATKASAASWERFRIVAYMNAYIIQHTISGLAAGLQDDGSLIDNMHDIDNSALWTIE